MKKLNKLIQNCKCGVYLTINKHKDYCETVEQHFKNNPTKEDINPEVYEKMKELNTIIEFRYYPDTPIGFYNV